MIKTLQETCKCSYCLGIGVAYSYSIAFLSRFVRQQAKLTTDSLRIPDIIEKYVASGIRYSVLLGYLLAQSMLGGTAI